MAHCICIHIDHCIPLPATWNKVFDTERQNIKNKLKPILDIIHHFFEPISINMAILHIDVRIYGCECGCEQCLCLYIQAGKQATSQVSKLSALSSRGTWVCGSVYVFLMLIGAKRLFTTPNEKYVFYSGKTVVCQTKLFNVPFMFLR